ncbi:MAG: N-acetylmuramoyl-L-alanine amidase [Caldiserica bacterium]|nr:N-acetylmuramoyl-L-alanine amidase [Caldisericota bacterium]
MYSSERGAQASREGCDILISLHSNSGSPQARGIEAWFAHGNEEGKRLASAVLKVLLSETKAVSRGIKDDADWHPASDPTWTEGMGVLRNFRGPGVLLEVMFISNPEEEKLLRSSEFLKRCAYAIALGVKDFISSWKRGSGDSRSGSAQGDCLKGSEGSLGSAGAGSSASGSGSPAQGEGQGSGPGGSGSPSPGEGLCSGSSGSGSSGFWESPPCGNGSPAPEPFPDLSPTLWDGKARKMLLVLHDLGIVTGYEDGTFRPEQPITRMEAASIIYQALVYLGKLPTL